jgi:hypothetical protein
MQVHLTTVKRCSEKHQEKLAYDLEKDMKRTFQEQQKAGDKEESIHGTSV